MRQVLWQVKKLNPSHKQCWKQKTEKPTSDSQQSITMCRTDSDARDTGSMVFLLKGQRKKFGYMDQFLLDSSTSIGSTIVMTENAFMTIAAWEDLMPSVCKELHAINKFVARKSTVIYA